MYIRSLAKDVKRHDTGVVVMLSCARPSPAQPNVALHVIVCLPGNCKCVEPMTPCITGQVKDDAGVQALAAHAAGDAEGSSVSADNKNSDAALGIEAISSLDEEEDDDSSLDDAPGGRARHAAKSGMRASIAAAVAAAADGSDSDYCPPGKGVDDGTPRRSLRSGRGRAAQAFSGPAKARACSRLNCCCIISICRRWQASAMVFATAAESVPE